MDTYLFALFGALIGLNVFYGLLMIYIQKRGSERENKLLKALIAKNLPEYTVSEATPREQITKMKVENDLATKAVKIEEERSKRDSMVIPIS